MNNNNHQPLQEYDEIVFVTRSSCSSNSSFLILIMKNIQIKEVFLVVITADTIHKADSTVLHPTFRLVLKYMYVCYRKFTT